MTQQDCVVPTVMYANLDVPMIFKRKNAKIFLFLIQNNIVIIQIDER